MAESRKGSATSSFGVSKRESHDASAFYARFTAPQLIADDCLGHQPDEGRNRIFPGDARRMDEVRDGSVALVVTSPPYFAGKQYEEHLGNGSVPATYLEYLQMLESVFSECVNKLEPGGRIAVNVANLGRRPYRSLSSDMIAILQDRLRLLLRGEIIWQKARGSSGSCAWGSFQKPSNPVLRDVTERVIVASKGRFDRALSVQERAARGLPSEGIIDKDEFFEATTDIWEIPPESATRVNHPAPFPVELPARLIRLYTYRQDLILDPFMGSGTSAVAAIQSGRHFVGYETDAGYRATAQQRIDSCALPAPRQAADQDVPEFQAQAVRQGHAAKQLAGALLKECGFTGIEPDVRLQHGLLVSFRALDRQGKPWIFDVCGGFTGISPGLARSDVLWKALSKAAVIHAGSRVPAPLVLLTTHLPAKSSAADHCLRTLWGPGKAIADVIRLRDVRDQARLRDLAACRNYGVLF